MEKVSYYWYNRQSIPHNVTEKINSLVSGEVIDVIDIGAVSKKLLRVDGSVFREVFFAKQILFV